MFFIATMTPEERDRAVDECGQCHMQDEEYRALTAYGLPLRWAMDWLRRREFGLERGRSELSHREEQIILMVNGEIERGKASRAERRMKKKD